MSDRKFRVAFIGAGNIISSRHISTFKASGRCELVGVVDANAGKAEMLARKTGIPNHAADMKAGWFQGVEAVCIGTPPFKHYDSAVEALERGKHVMLEKPMCMKVEEASSLVDMARERKLILTVVHNFQFASSAMRLKALIAEGRLGRIRNILGFQVTNDARRLPQWHEALPYGLLYDEAPHLLYLLQAFGGGLEIENASFTPSTTGRTTPALVTASIKSERCPCSLYINFESPVCEWQLVVFGEMAAGVVDIFRDVLVVLPHDGQHLAYEVMRTSLMGTWMHYAGVLRSAMKRLSGKLFYGNETVVQRFLDAVETGVGPADVSGEDGLVILRAQHELMKKLGAGNV